MLESEMEINKLEEEKQLLINRIKYLEERNNELEVELKDCQDIIHNGSLVAVDLVEEDRYGNFLETEESDDLAKGYAETMNISNEISEVS